MHGLKKMLLEEEARLRKIAEQTKEQLKVAPEGILRVSKCKNQVQYYQRIPGVTEKMENIFLNLKLNWQSN